MKNIKFLVIFIIVAIFIYFINDNTKSNNTKDIVIENNNLTTNNDTLNKENDEFVPIFSYSSIPDSIKDKMIGISMPENEPINFDELSYLNLTYYGFDDNTHIGEMIVNSQVASEVVDIFKELYNKKYPIEKIRLIDEYNAVDEDSMSDNNSSSFCYRTISGTNKISNHGKGLAIDINPLQNPHVKGDKISPAKGSMYKDRSISQKGMIIKGDDLYNAFIKRGWKWGGDWTNPDYQHFEKALY